MRHFLHKMFYKTEDKRNHNRLLYFKFGCMLMLALLFTCLPSKSIQAASGLKIYNYTTRKESNYTGKQVKVNYNGNQISVNKTPGILIDGSALVSYKDIFVNSGIDADYVYNNAAGTVIIKKNGITIKMTTKSKIAFVNGKKVTMPVAPVKIKYIDANITKVLVPSRFVSETLGVSYTWYSNRNTVEIVNKSIQLAYNGGKKFEYKGTLGYVSIDNENIALGSMPSVILNNTAMLRAKKVFASSQIGAEYKYNKDNKTVTLTKNGNELVMTIGSSDAYLNGQRKTLDQGPIIIQNYEAKTSYVMVPGNATASYLGYDYSWNKVKSMSLISSRDTSDNDQEDNNGSNKDPELGDVGVIIDPGNILYQWQANDSLIGKSNGIHELNQEIVSEAKGFIYTINRDYNNVKQNAEIFTITSNTPFEKVTSNISGKVITIQASNMECINQVYQMFSSSNIVTAIATSYNAADSSSTIAMDISKDHITYDLSLSADKLNLYVTVYQKSLSSAVIGTNTVGDYLTLTGIEPKNVTFTKQDDLLYIDLLNTTNGIGDLYSYITGAKYLKHLYTIGFADKTRLVLQLNDGYDYYISENENQYTVSFIAQGGITLPEVPSDSEESEYEIVIPKPEGISNEMITHVDYYYDNQFAIKIMGDHTAFYTNNSVIENSNVITDVLVFLNDMNETEIRFSTSRLQGYEFKIESENIYVHIGEPRDIYKNIVVLDPGHGGPANGAAYFGIKEKNVNLQILYQIGNKYFNSNPWQLKVYYTRSSDVDMSLSNRSSFAKKVGADLFVSLHMNASTASYAKGTEVYYSGSNNANLAGLTSKTIANTLVKNLCNTLGTENRGAKSERYTVVYKNTVPAVLIELGFLSNKNDFALITESSFQEKAVYEIYETLLQLFEDYPTGR